MCSKIEHNIIEAITIVIMTVVNIGSPGPFFMGVLYLA